MEFLVPHVHQLPCCPLGHKGCQPYLSLPSFFLHGNCLALGPDTPIPVHCLHSTPGDLAVKFPLDTRKMRLSSSPAALGLTQVQTRKTAGPQH